MIFVISFSFIVNGEDACELYIVQAFSQSFSTEEYMMQLVSLLKVLMVQVRIYVLGKFKSTTNTYYGYECDQNSAPPLPLRMGEFLVLKTTEIRSSAVFEMSIVRLASVLAAFVLRYDGQMVEQFDDVRVRLRELFVLEWIQGATSTTGKK